MLEDNLKRQSDVLRCSLSVCVPALSIETHLVYVYSTGGDCCRIHNALIHIDLLLESKLGSYGGKERRRDSASN